MNFDRAFTAGIGRDRSSEVIIEGFLSTARGLGASVVAEGVETPDQQVFLAERGCDAGQGYLFGRLMVAQDALDFVRETHGIRQGRAG